MLFASTDLATRIERAECALVSDGAHAASSRRNLTDAFVLECAGAVAAYTEPGSPLNKVAGLGVTGSIDDETLARVQRAYKRVNCPLQVELSTLADPAVGAMLTERGCVLRGIEKTPLTTHTPLPK